LSIKTIFDTGKIRVQLEGRPIEDFDFSKDSLKIVYQFPTIALFLMELKAKASNPEYFKGCTMTVDSHKYNVVGMKEIAADKIRFELEKD